VNECTRLCSLYIYRRAEAPVAIPRCDVYRVLRSAVMADEHFDESLDLCLPAKLFRRSVSLAFDIGTDTLQICLPLVFAYFSGLESTYLGLGLGLPLTSSFLLEYSSEYLNEYSSTR